MNKKMVWNNIVNGSMVFIPKKKKAGLVCWVESLEQATVRHNHNNIKTDNNAGRRVHVLFDHNTVVECQLGDVEPLASEVFHVGERVMSVLGGGFTGTVTSIEIETNRVICVSDKISSYDDYRTRWAYRLSEIIAYKPIEFKNLEMYRIDKVVEVFVTGHPTMSDKCNLVVCNNGNIFKHAVPRSITPKELHDNYNIKILERL